VVSNWSNLASTNKIVCTLARLLFLMVNNLFSIFTPDNIHSDYDIIILFSFFWSNVWSSLQTWLCFEKGFLFVFKSPDIVIKDLG
jgi:hypothetical protein